MFRKRYFQGTCKGEIFFLKHSNFPTWFIQTILYIIQMAILTIVATVQILYRDGSSKGRYNLCIKEKQLIAMP